MARKQRKTMSGAVRGMDAFFTSTADAEEENEPQVSASAGEDELERVTVYLRPDQDSWLTETKAKLKRKRIKTNRSELVRVAVDVLGNLDLEKIESLIEDTNT